ncbi:MAG TPA: Coenzyme F420 hydrogenase/dehydrogenase, beta subunit C-terminal domain [Spirochaetota bacterium]|nr:Coenzyme F420 hydrogenase/dehydrogenase, beta subunit C-terminal domain [Spirochaetota bacterium]HPJ35287.1 Coenzyme F420 hydrogenase/dehydrogenase, beta subunit C-terminal domain [Spirochaetota bacterium]
MQVKGSKEVKASVIDSGLCTGCGACVSLCPYFVSHRGRTVMLFSCSRDQGRCHAHCPRSEVNLDKLSSKFFGETYTGSPFGSYLEIQATGAGEKADLKNFQTAGTVSALIKFALAKGYIDSAVLTGNDSGYGVPLIVEKPADVEKTAGSKYSVSPTVKGVNEAINSGLKKIGAVGTPCQVTAIAKMRFNPIEDENFRDPIALSIGLFCTWALRASDFTALLRSKGDPSVIKKLDIPPPPASVMSVETGSRSYDIPLEEIRTLIPEACTYCHDMTAEFADISVGVFEGKKRENITIIRTDRGRKIFREAVSEGYITAREIQDSETEPLADAALNKKRKGLARLADAGLINSESGDSVIKVDNSVLEKILTGGV